MEDKEESASVGSMRSGGRCSLSISDLRASVKLVILSLIPSAPLARAPAGSLEVPLTFFSSETDSDSSLLRWGC